MRQRKRNIFLLILIPLFLFSCKKKSTVHITARNAVTGEPYAGLTYNIERSVSGSFKNHYKTVASGTLDENGEAYITKRFSKNWSHEVSIGSPDNTCYSNNNSFYFSGGENINCDFKFAECAYLKLRIQNVNCQGITDSMRFRSKYLYDHKWQGWSTYRTSCYDFLSPEYFEVSQGTRMYEWEVNRNGNKTTYSDSITLNKGGSATFLMEY